MGRRAHGEGSLFQRKDGRWARIIDLGWVDGHRKRKYVYGATQAEALRKIREAQKTPEAGLPIPSDKLMVSAHLEHSLGALYPTLLEPSRRLGEALGLRRNDLDEEETP